MVPLGLVAAEERAEVIQVRLGCRSTARRTEDHVEAMGLRVGKIVEILRNDGGGPILLKVDESRIAVGRGIAMKILVRRME